MILRSLKLIQVIQQHLPSLHKTTQKNRSLALTCLLINVFSFKDARFEVVSVLVWRTHLQLQALVQHHPALHPGLLQVGPLAVQRLQLLLDLRAGVVPAGQQLLPKLLKGLEGARTGIDLSAVLLEKEKEREKGRQRRREMEKNIFPQQQRFKTTLDKLWIWLNH